MVRIAPIKLQYSSKVLWFDPNFLELNKGDAVVVSTARGLEYGHLAEDLFEVEDEEIKKLKTELKPVKRLATPEDDNMAQQMEEKSAEALPIFKEMAAEANDDMHPVSVEFLLDGDKAIFYFEAEERIDFRELVKKLASRFRVRIDMRQIGVRDEARIVGGLGHCGQELCCKRLGGEFSPVSIRMAKEQDLSLNPQKISGICGRLMCCLRYEFDVYKEFKERAPKINATISTPEGSAKVVDLNVPREIVSIQLPGEKPVKVPLDQMEATEKGGRPNKVCKKVYDCCCNASIFESLDSGNSASLGSKKLFDGPLKSEGKDGGSGKDGRSAKSAEDTRKPRRRSRGAKNNKGEASSEAGSKVSGEKIFAKKRHNDSDSSGGVDTEKSRRQPRKRKNKNTESGAVAVGNTQERTDDSGQQKQGLRPGQKSSGLRNGDNRGSQGQRPSSPQGQGEAKNKKDQGQYRRPRNRRHNNGVSETGNKNEV